MDEKIYHINKNGGINFIGIVFKILAIVKHAISIHDCIINKDCDRVITK